MSEINGGVESPVPESTEGQQQEETSAEDKKVLRRKTVKFVVAFIVSVFALLAGYEYAKGSKADDWYLLQAARTTSWLLRWVGYSSGVENNPQFAGKEAEIRATIAAWETGTDPVATAPAPTASATPSAAPQPPLTAWEMWRYKAVLFRRMLADAEKEVAAIQNDASLAEPTKSQRLAAAQAKYAQLAQRDIGPLVSFVWTPSTSERIADLQRELSGLKREPAGKESRIAAIEAEIARLQQAKQTESPGGDPRKQGKRFFNFSLVPDCGAIPVMAIFVAAVLAFPASWVRRLAGVLIGLPVLYIVNALRLVTLAVIGAVCDRAIFDFAHHYVWQGIYIVFVVAVWMGWVEFIVRRKT